jgi:hypothetical protein
VRAFEIVSTSRDYIDLVDTVFPYQGGIRGAAEHRAALKAFKRLAEDFTSSECWCIASASQPGSKLHRIASGLGFEKSRK